LSESVARVFGEDQVYRIDHYLGKETVQNVLILRFANVLFEPVWNRNFIDHVQITVAESDGVGHRAGYYERSGALRDMVQNHLLQLLCLVAMEPPPRFNAEEIREEKVKVLRSVRPISAKEVSRVAVRGQYSAGRIDGQSVPEYRAEKEVAPDSSTETFFALQAFVDNWRWQDVPFYLRTGKRMARKTSEIAIQFKPVPHLVFDGVPVSSLSPNTLVLRIQPDEGISLRFETKHPGPKLCMSSVDMAFAYQDSFGIAPPEAYERLLLDCMAGDQTLFSRRDWVELSWAYLAPVLEQWSRESSGIPSYPAGSWGPSASDDLISAGGRAWRNG
jgi:glucose-6-phosphate 1-dehydrogenase